MMSTLGAKNITNNTQTLLIWDAKSPPPVGDWTTVLWSSFGSTDDPNVVSIPVLVEEQSDYYRTRYLTWFFDLGEKLINGKRLVDHLELRPGFSYWWMMSLAEKFNASGTSQINNAVKALALESFVSEHKPKSIVLVSDNDKLALTLRNYCDNLQLSFEWRLYKSTENEKSLLRRLYGYLPWPIQAFISFSKFIFKNLPLLCAAQAQTPIISGETAFVDILVHLDRDSFKSGRFISNYWTALVDKLMQSKVKTNWLHNYYYQQSIPTSSRAQALIEGFNKCTGQFQTHALIDANLSLSVCVIALKDYFLICKASFRFPNIKRSFCPANSDLDFWPLFKQELLDSLRGPRVLHHCLRLSLYEKTFYGIPYQKYGVYIQENQPWEMALIHSWKAAGHGKLIGVPHTTVRYWDLRYFYDSRSYYRGKNALPMPDLVAVNGPVAKKLYLEGGYPEQQLTEVEALRYFHLLKGIPTNVPAKPRIKLLKILVCGDFLSSTNHTLLSWLAIAAQSLPQDISYVLKPHPAYPIDTSDLPSLITLEVTNAPLPELFTDCDVVFTSNITSAAVDAYCSGVPVIQMLDGQTFNVSPLRSLKGAEYVRNPMELIDALHNAHQRELLTVEPYFYLDEDLPRWRNLLGLGVNIDENKSV